MSRARWPKEAPVFEVTLGGELICAGAHVEGIEIDPKIEGVGYLGVRVLFGENPYSANIHPTEEWFAGCVPVDDLRPLTPAARDMLTMVKRG